MTPLRPLLWLILIAALLLPGPSAEAFVDGIEGRNGDSESENESDSESQGSLPAIPDDDDDDDDDNDDEDDDDGDPEAAAARKRIASPAEVRQMERKREAAREAIEAAKKREDARLLAEMMESRAFDSLFSDDELAEMSASPARPETLAEAASSAAAPAPALARSVLPDAILLPDDDNPNIAGHSGEFRAAPPGAPATAALLQPLRLSGLEENRDHAELVAGLDNLTDLRAVKKVFREYQRARLTKVRTAFETLMVTSGAVRPSRFIGQMPRDLAADLVELADRRNRAGEDQASTKIPISPPGAGIADVRSLATLDGGFDQAPVAQTSGRPGTIERLGALQELHEAAASAARDFKKRSTSRDKLNALSRDAKDEHDRLLAFLRSTAESFPLGFASVHLPAEVMNGPKAGQGQNSAPPMLSYDFSTDSFHAEGPLNAVFKATEARIKAGGNIHRVGVDLDGAVPFRTEQRSLATLRMAEALGIRDLMVDMRIAHLDDANRTMGLLMEHAGGNPGLYLRYGDPSLPELNTHASLRLKLTEAQAALAWFDGGQNGPKPQTPQLTAERGDLSNKTRDEWFNIVGNQTTQLANDIVKDRNLISDPPGAVTTPVRPFNNRHVTDADLAHPELRRQLMNAQWLDLLCGQVDRHMGNLHIDTASGTPMVKLIDNDLSFGHDNEAYGLARPDQTPDKAFRLPPKPLVIDADFKKALVLLNSVQAQTAVAGMLTPAEMKALTGRLEMLQTYAQSGAVTEVHRPGSAGAAAPGALTWASDPALLFRGHDRRDINPQGGEYSYYSLLKSLDEMPAGVADYQLAPLP